MTSKRYAVTIHDVGNICDDPRNVHTILTSTDRIAPRERVEVVELSADPLAAAATMLAEYEHGMPRPEWERLADALRGRTIELRRGVTLTTPADGEGSPVYVENQTGSVYDEATNIRTRDVRTGTTLTVYGTVTRGQRASRGSVEIINRPGQPDAQGNTIRAYWRSMTGAAVPDGARADVAAAVLALITELMPPSAWAVLADEADRARRSADIGRHVSEAVRAIEQAQRAPRGAVVSINTTPSPFDHDRPDYDRPDDWEHTYHAHDGALVLVSKVGGGTIGRTYTGTWHYCYSLAGRVELGSDLVTGSPTTHDEAAALVVDYFTTE